MDTIDLQIMKILARDSRTSYMDIASAVGYEKECILWVKNIDKTIKEQDLSKKVSLIGDIFVYAKQLEGASCIICVICRAKSRR